MKHDTADVLDLTQFDMSEERGFLPDHDPVESQPQFPGLNHLRTELPKFLAARQFHHWINEQEMLMPDGMHCDDSEMSRAAFRLLSFAAHAYVWEDPDDVAQRLPAVLAIQWWNLAKKLGRPPVLSYAS